MEIEVPVDGLLTNVDYSRRRRRVLVSPPVFLFVLVSTFYVISLAWVYSVTVVVFMRVSKTEL